MVSEVNSQSEQARGPNPWTIQQDISYKFCSYAKSLEPSSNVLLNIVVKQEAEYIFRAITMLLFYILQSYWVNNVDIYEDTVPHKNSESYIKWR